MRVLIVEDDPMVRTINKGYLKKIDASFEIYEASSIESAKAVLETENIQLILLDVYLGEGRGPDPDGGRTSRTPGTAGSDRGGRDAVRLGDRRRHCGHDVCPQLGGSRLRSHVGRERGDVGRASTEVVPPVSGSGRRVPSR